MHREYRISNVVLSQYDKLQPGTTFPVPFELLEFINDFQCEDDIVFEVARRIAVSDLPKDPVQEYKRPQVLKTNRASDADIARDSDYRGVETPDPRDYAEQKPLYVSVEIPDIYDE